MVAENSSGSNGRCFDASTPMYRVGQGANVDRLGWGKVGCGAIRRNKARTAHDLVAYSLEKLSMMRISMLEIFSKFSPPPSLRLRFSVSSILFWESGSDFFSSKDVHAATNPARTESGFACDELVSPINRYVSGKPNVWIE